ncbi:MAG: hypothetical protein V3T72_02120 [Thermoanaerobaculia bacterium]
MKKTAPVLVLLLLLLSLLSLSALPAIADDTTTLNGGYKWDRGTKGALEAVFTVDGEGSWDVAFHFKHRSRSHVYQGTAEGSLSEGELKGTVTTEDESRTFSFTCTYEDGTFRGTHSEVFGDRRKKTGTLSLKAAVSSPEAVR